MIIATGCGKNYKYLAATRADFLLPVMVSIFHPQTITTTTTICNHQKHGNIWQNIHWLSLTEQRLVKTR
jgi:hypothetical protein